MDFVAGPRDFFGSEMLAKARLGRLDQRVRGGVELDQTLGMVVGKLLEMLCGQISGELEATSLNARRHLIETEASGQTQH